MNVIRVPNSTELISGIGVGFNCFTGQQMTSALAANPTVTQLGLDSQSFFKICYSAEDFNNTITHSLGVSAQINLKKASSSPDSISDSSSSSDSTFSDPSVSSTLSLSNALSINDTSVSVIVYARVENIHQALSQCQLSSSIPVPTTQTECLNFYQQYGDSFVSELTEGAEYVAVFVFSCQTQEDQRSLQEALTAQVTVNVCDNISPEVGANLTAGLTATLNNTTVRCQIYQSLVGSNASLPTFGSDVNSFIGSIVSAAQSLNANTPVVFDFALTGYETLFGSNLSASFINIATNRQIYIDYIAPTVTNLGHLATKYQWIATAYQAYNYSGDTTFITNQKQLNSDINNVNAWISSVAGNPTQTPSIPSSMNPPLSLMNGTPVFNYLVPTQPLYGNTSNEPFQDIDVGSVVSSSSSTTTATTALNAGINGSISGNNSPSASLNYSRITSQTTGIAAAMSNIPVLYMITVWGNNNVAQFYASYNTLNYSNPFAHGAANVSSCHGATLFLTPDHQDDGVNSLDNHVYISNMSGQVSGGVIAQLSFTDSVNQSITQPSNASGSSFSWTLPQGATLIGFQGYCNSNNLVGLQPICISVQPAKWLAPSIETMPFVTTLPVSTLGVGYNSFLGSGLPNSALNSSACVSVNQGAQNEAIIKICASRQSLAETLSKTTGFSIGVLGFKLSHSKTTTKTIQVTDTDVSVVLISRVVTSSPVYTQCALSPTLANLSAEQFLIEYGDSFVCATVNGGLYVAVFVFQCDSSAVQETVQKTLSVSASIKSASLNASLSSDLSNAQSSKGVNLTCYQQVIGSSSFTLPNITGNVKTDAENLVQAASSFSAKDIDTPCVLSFMTMGYETLLPSSALSSFQPIVTNRQTYQLQVAPTLTQLYGVWAEILTISQVYTTYNYNGDVNMDFTDAENNSGLVISAINGFNSWLDSVIASPLEVVPLSSSLNPPLALTVGSPSLNYSVTVAPCNSLNNISAIWGGVNSSPFQDICAGQAFFNSNPGFNGSNPANNTPTPIALKDLPTIASIELHSGYYIDQLTTTYSYTAGVQSFSHGGGGGGPSFSLNLRAGEFISSVGGTYGDYINQLSFTTTMGQTYTYPLSPQNTGGKISWTAAENQVLLGFQGSSGKYLNQLQLILLNLNPSIWSKPLLYDLSTPWPSLPVTGVGIGFNSFTNSAMPNSAFDLSALTIGAQKATGKQWYQVCSSGQSVSHTLKYAFGGGADGDSLHRKVMRTAKISDLAVTLVIYVSHEQTSPIINGTPQLTSNAQSLLSSSPEQFYSAYGDSYVSSVGLGLEYMALFVFECSSLSEQQSVLNSLSAQGIVPSEPPVTLGANFSHQVTSAVSSLTLDFYAYQLIRGSDTPLPNPYNSVSSSSSSSSSSTNKGAALLMKVLNPEISKLSIPYATSTTTTSNPADSVTCNEVIQSLIDFALGLSDQNVTGLGVALSRTTAGYETLVSKVSSSWQTLVNNRDTSCAIAFYLGAIATINNQMQVVADFYQRYDYSDGEFVLKCTQLNSDYQTLRAQQTALVLNPFGASPALTMPQSIINGVPSVNYRVTTSPIWGSEPANTDFWDINSQIAISCETINGGTVTTATCSNNTSNPTPIPLSQLPVLISVSIWGSDYVYQIGTTYQTLNGTQQFAHGGASVNAWPALNLGKGEFITGINYLAGDYVNALQFSTNFGQTSLLVPTDCQSASKGSWSVPSGSTLIGFQGSSGDYLNQLQAVCLTFSPATWSPISVGLVPWLGNYTQTTYSPWAVPPQLTISLDTESSSVQVYLDGSLINGWSFDPSTSLLTWPATGGNWSSASLTFSINGSGQNSFTGTLQIVAPETPESGTYSGAISTYSTAISFPYNQSVQAFTTAQGNCTLVVCATTNGIGVGQIVPPSNTIRTALSSNEPNYEYECSFAYDIDTQGSSTSTLAWILSAGQESPPYYFLVGSIAGNLWLYSCNPPSSSTGFSSSNISEVAKVDTSNIDTAIASILYYPPLNLLFVGGENGNLYTYSVSWNQGVPSFSYQGANKNYDSSTGCAVSLSLISLSSGTMSLPGTTGNSNDLSDFLIVTGLCQGSQNGSFYFPISSANNGVLPNATGLIGYTSNSVATVVADLSLSNQLVYTATQTQLVSNSVTDLQSPGTIIWTASSESVPQLILSMAYAPPSGSGNGFPKGALLIGTVPVSSGAENNTIGSIYVYDPSAGTVSLWNSQIPGSPFSIYADDKLHFLVNCGATGLNYYSLVDNETSPSAATLIVNTAVSDQSPSTSFSSVLEIVFPM
jgi:hypothetical protein